MPSRQTVNQALARVHDLPTLTQHLLTDTLHWPIENKIETIEEISFGWTPQELQAQGLEEHLLDGQAWQIRPFREDQPWASSFWNLPTSAFTEPPSARSCAASSPIGAAIPSAHHGVHDNLLFILHLAQLRAFHLRPLPRRAAPRVGQPSMGERWRIRFNAASVSMTAEKVVSDERMNLKPNPWNQFSTTFSRAGARRRSPWQPGNLALLRAASSQDSERLRQRSRTMRMPRLRIVRRHVQTLAAT